MTFCPLPVHETRMNVAMFNGICASTMPMSSKKTSPMYSPLDALGPSLYRIAWYKMEWPHDGAV